MNTNYILMSEHYSTELDMLLAEMKEAIAKLDDFVMQLELTAVLEKRYLHVFQQVRILSEELRMRYYYEMSKNVSTRDVVRLFKNAPPDEKLQTYYRLKQYEFVVPAPEEPTTSKD